MYWGIGARGKGHCSGVWLWMWLCLGLNFGIPPKTRGCSVHCRPVCSHSSFMSCLWLIQWGCTWETGNDKGPHKTEVVIMLNSYTICFLMIHKLFLTIVSTSNFEVLQTPFSGKVCWKFFPVLFANAKDQLSINIYDIAKGIPPRTRQNDFNFLLSTGDIHSKKGNTYKLINSTSLDLPST